MQKYFKTSVFLLLAAVFLTVACKHTVNNTSLPVYTVSFDLNGGGGVTINAKKITKNEKVTKPTETPTRAHYVFQHWSKTKEGAAYDFSAPVTSNFTLYAVWKQNDPSTPAPNKFTITVQSDNGSDAQTYDVKQGEKLPKLPNAKKKGALFKYWSKTQNGTEGYNFDDPVTETFTLYAVYYEIPTGQKRIYDIQGKNHVSPVEGHSFTKVPGIVTAISYGAEGKGKDKKIVRTGFYMQDQDGDDNTVTSDGVYIYNKKLAAQLEAGDAILLDGKVTEFIGKGYKKEERLTVTQLAWPLAMEKLSSGNPLPKAITLTPDMMTKTVATGAIGSLEPDTEAIDFYESLEGMRVKVEKPKVVAEHYGNTYYIAPYNANDFSYRGGIMKPEYDSNGNHVAAALIPLYITGCFDTKENAGAGDSHATIGDSYNGDITGVMDYHNGKFASNYQISLTEKLPPLNRGSISPEGSTIRFADDKLNVVSYNLKNFSAGNDGDDKRAAQFAKHFINELKAPDIICLIEIQDDNGALKKDKNGNYPPLDGTVNSEATLNLLIDKMKEEDTGKVYDKLWINPQDGIDGGAPGSNIRCAYLYRTDRVELVPDEDGSPTGIDASDTKAEIIAGGMQLKANPARIGIGEESFNKCRKSLVAHFKFKNSINGGKDFFMINNHLSSKRGDAPVWGSVQPAPRKSDAPRHQQAQIVKTFIDSILAARSDAMIVSVGDYNDFWFSKTMDIMKGDNMKNAIEELPKNQRYTFVYDACSQTLDNILAPRHATISGADVLNVNSEFGGKLSDHDPVFVQLSW